MKQTLRRFFEKQLLRKQLKDMTIIYDIDIIYIATTSYFNHIVQCDFFRS